MGVPDNKREELTAALREGIRIVPENISVINERLIECANLLRVEQSEKVFNDLTVLIDNMSHLMELIGEIKGGLDLLGNPTDRLQCWDKLLPVFKDMVSAFDGKDWVTVADLIQYELNPLLDEGSEGLRKTSEEL